MGGGGGERLVKKFGIKGWSQGSKLAFVGRRTLRNSSLFKAVFRGIYS